MKKTSTVYGLALAIAAFGLQWLDYQYSVRLFATEIYIGIIAAVFTGLGLWAGYRIARQSVVTRFEKNQNAVESLRISDREYDVLCLLAEGQSNKEISQDLCVSPNTIKTHVARLYDKLDVSRRTQAVNKARNLRLIA